jgi:lipopolysaccharide/colanic/teichoic acid biosynthesis glycosyltransferase
MNPLVVVELVKFAFVEKRLVDVAFVVVELVTVRPVMLASVATKLEKNPLVVVEF